MTTAKSWTRWRRWLAAALMVTSPGCHWLRGDDPVCADVCCEECKRLPPVQPCWDTSFYGYSPTCWYRFPMGWAPCPAPDWTQPAPAPQMVLPAPLEIVKPNGHEIDEPVVPEATTVPLPDQPPVSAPSETTSVPANAQLDDESSIAQPEPLQPTSITVRPTAHWTNRTLLTPVRVTSNLSEE